MTTIVSRNFALNSVLKQFSFVKVCDVKLFVVHFKRIKNKIKDFLR